MAAATCCGLPKAPGWELHAQGERLPLLPVPARPCSCNTEQGEASICRLAGVSFDVLLPSHDATGKGLSPADVQAFCAALPAAARAA